MELTFFGFCSVWILGVTLFPMYTLEVRMFYGKTLKNMKTKCFWNAVAMLQEKSQSGQILNNVAKCN